MVSGLPGRDGTAAVAVLGATTRQTRVDEILGHPKVESLATELRETAGSKEGLGFMEAAGKAQGTIHCMPPLKKHFSFLHASQLYVQA